MMHRPWYIDRALYSFVNVAANFCAPLPPTPAAVQAAYGRLPLHFEANRGQVDARVDFLARGPRYTLFLTADEAVLSLTPSPDPSPQ